LRGTYLTGGAGARRWGAGGETGKTMCARENLVGSVMMEALFAFEVERGETLGCFRGAEVNRGDGVWEDE
jgi:hypothetical protein